MCISEKAASDIYAYKPGSVKVWLYIIAHFKKADTQKWGLTPDYQQTAGQLYHVEQISRLI